MRTKKKGKGLISLAMAILLTVLVGCSNSNGSGDSDGTESGSGNSFNLWLSWSTTINNDSLVQKYWREKEPGIDVKLEATQGDAVTALNLKLNTGGFKDAAIFSRSDTVKNAMVRSNSIMSLEQYFDMPNEYPGLASIPKQYLERMKDTDGHIWSIPTWYDQDPSDPWPGWASVGWIVRSDILEKTGMNLESLKTLEDIEAFLKKVAGQQDESGRPVIPMSFLMDPSDSFGWNDENAILSAFGVSTSGIGVEKKGDQFVFAYDDPNYKAAYQWLNKLYREKLIDPEVVTNKKEQYQEKNKAGRVALNVGSFFNVPNSTWETLDGPTGTGWYYELIPFPKVEGVDNIGFSQVVNPSPGYDVYINKNSKNLESILKFFDYTLQPKPEMQQIVNEGPAGLYWDWNDKELDKWKYIDESYEQIRNSGDAAQKAKVTPELYMTSSFSNSWYPWWNNEVDKAGYSKTLKFTEEIGKMGGVRTAHSYDLVPTKPGGQWEKYSPELENIRKEYRAKFLMAEDAAQFESVWNMFRDALEKRAHWTELKQEWQQSYQEDIQAHGEF